MTTPVPIEYASPRPEATRGRPHWGLSAALALALGFLGANAFADAAGFPRPRENYHDEGYVALRVLCGVVVFVVSWVVFAFAFRELVALTNAMARATVRPSPAIALASMVCGTACVIAALLVQLYGQRNPVLSVGPGPQVAVGTPLMAHLVTVMAFLLGAGLIAVGIWSSMARPVQATQPLPPPA